MSTPITLTAPHPWYVRPTLRALTVAALVINAMSFVPDLVSSGPTFPYDLILGHMIPTLVVAGIVASRLRWAPALGALLGGLLLLDAYVFLTDMLVQPTSAADFAFAAIFFATAIVGLVAGAGATIQHYRAPRSRPFLDPPAPRSAYPALLALVALLLGGILTTAIQPRGTLPGVSPEALAQLPALTAKDELFEQPEIKAKVGEMVALRLDNADTSTHYLDIDEFNVHVLMPAGKSNLALFTPTQPGTYTFYCRPHADKVARTGMVGTLIVEP
jgi:heme/copper-type cytochrome/quinol oxidase subunit 2